MAEDAQTSTCYRTIYNLQDEMDRKMYTDQTGKLPATSYKDKQYVMVLHETGSNAILVEGLRNRTSGEMVATYQSMVDRLHERDIRPKMHVLDNEISQEFKNAIKANQMKFQLVPPNDHRRNVAEKAIQVFKDHFISVLCGTDVSFPMQLWCQILRQAEHQLNLLRKSRVDPSKSAFEILYGKHDYNAHPFAPLGSAVELHVTPNKRKTWGEHTTAGFYLGTAWEHYRCHVIWVKNTKSTRIGQTVFFRHKYITQPIVTQTDAILRATDDLINVLKGKKVIKGATRSVIYLLVDILKDYEGEPTKIEDQRAKMKKKQPN